MSNNGDNCIFCKIIKGDILAHTVYEDDLVRAFLDIKPIRSGHTLVIPKQHYPDIFTLPEETYHAVMTAAKRLAERITSTLKRQRVGMMVVGIDVSHAHVHVVPIKEPGDITSTRLLSERGDAPTTDQLAAMAMRLRIEAHT